MMEPIFYGILTTAIISLGSFAGILTLVFQEKLLSKIIFLLVSLSSGVLMGNAFIRLLPEASKTLPPDAVFGIALCAFIVFFLVEKLFHWRHCHRVNCDEHIFGYMNLFGDAVHNFIDGIIIGGTFVTGIPLGILMAVTVALHEIPKEMCDFGVLLHAGFTKKKALLSNFFVKLTIVMGSVLGTLFASNIHGFVSYLLPFAAGGFLYIAASDLIPEIKKEDNLKKSTISFLIFLSGIGLTYLTKMLGKE
jgi:zinc and cadmium transporter